MVLLMYCFGGGGAELLEGPRVFFFFMFRGVTVGHDDATYMHDTTLQRSPDLTH